MENKSIIRRFIAYFIDILVVTSIAYLISYLPINPNKDSYDNYYEELLELNEQYKDEELDQKEYLKLAEPVSYKISRYGVVYTLVNVTLGLVYFVFVQYKCNGQTLGKKICKIRLVSTKDKLSIGALTMRAILIYGTLTSCIDMIWLQLLPEASYGTASYVLELIQVILFYVSAMMVVIRLDNRGLHDIVANTKIELIEPNSNNDEKVIEADYEEK